MKRAGLSSSQAVASGNGRSGVVPDLCRRASGIAHDLDNLLAGLAGQLDLAQDALPIGHPSRQRLGALRQVVRQGHDMTDALWRMAGSEDARHERLNLAELVRDAVGLLAAVLGPGVRMELDVGVTGAWMQGDAGQLRRVLINLASNARRAMPDGGTLRVLVRTRGDQQAHASRLQVVSPAHVQLVVADTGVGLSPRVRQHLCEAPGPQQVSTRRGLGLWVVREIVTAHSGQLDVEAVPGGGTAWTMTFPAAAGPEVVDHPGRAAGSSPVDWPAKNLIVVSQNPHVRRGAGAALRALGSRVTEMPQAAAPADRAARWARDVHAAVIDLDQAGRVSGCMQALRSSPPFCGAVFLVGAPPTSPAWLRATDQILVKPFLMPQLLSSMTRTLTTSKPDAA